MFVRKHKNKSGTTSIHIIDKSSGAYRMVKSVGSARNPDTIERLVRKAHDELHPAHDIQPPLFATMPTGDAIVENFLDGVANAHVRTIGPECIFGAIFDAIGFNAIRGNLFRHLVIARLAYPASKLKTVDYLERYQGTHTTEDAIYKYLDRFVKQRKADAERIAYEHTKRTLGTIVVAFYDMTTLYFEAEDEDDLRKIGYSKDGKFQHPQIMIGLLVGEGGFPIGYDVFDGNTFEGHTLVPTLEKLSAKYKLGKPVVVADAAMLSKRNLEELVQHEYTFIVGGRIKNERDVTKAEILKRSADMKDGASFEIAREDATRLVVTYKDKRAKKDWHNREKGVRKLRERVKSGRLTKAQINNRGYNKFLALEGSVTIAVDEDKIAEDARWDGLKGYVTNTDMPAKKIAEQYGYLWQIEKAFRISKTDMRIRPVFHYRKRRIEAHICIAFVAYAIYKELERLLADHRAGFSPKRAAELTHTMYALDYTLPQSKTLRRRALAMDEEQRLLYEIIHKK